jgi:hypothetical protein
VDDGLVPAGLLRAARRVRGRRKEPDRTSRQFRSRRAWRREACHAGRILSLYGPVLLPLHSRYARQGRTRYGHESSRVPLRARPEGSATLVRTAMRARLIGRRVSGWPAGASRPDVLALVFLARAMGYRPAASRGQGPPSLRPARDPKTVCPSNDSHSGLSFCSCREMTVRMTVEREQAQRTEAGNVWVMGAEAD